MKVVDFRGASSQKIGEMEKESVPGDHARQILPLVWLVIDTDLAVVPS